MGRKRLVPAPGVRFIWAPWLASTKRGKRRNEIKEVIAVLDGKGGTDGVRWRYVDGPKRQKFRACGYDVFRSGAVEPPSEMVEVEGSSERGPINLVEKKTGWAWSDGVSALLFERSAKRALPTPWLSIDGPVNMLKLPWASEFKRRIDRLVKSLGFDYVKDRGERIGGWTHVGSHHAGSHRLCLARFTLLLRKRRSK